MGYGTGGSRLSEAGLRGRGIDSLLVVGFRGYEVAGYPGLWAHGIDEVGQCI